MEAKVLDKLFIVARPSNFFNVNAMKTQVSMANLV